MRPIEASGTPSSPPAGWYPDPEGGDRQRYWDGARWTDAYAPRGGTPPPRPGGGEMDASRTWAMVAHLSALLALVIGLPFVGPLVVYLIRSNDPYVRRHAAEALNFNLSFTLYAIVLGAITVVLIIVLVGLLLIPVLIVLLLAWLVLVVVASVRASQGEDYRYPLTIRFVS